MVALKYDDQARRAYWSGQMDQAFQFMNTVCEYPVEESGEPLVSLPQAVGGASVEVVFSETPFAGQCNRVFCLRVGLIESFLTLTRAMNNRGWILKLEDGYRSAEMQTLAGRVPMIFDIVLQRVMWELGDAVPDPDLMYRRVSALVATRPRVATHMSGSAIDISVLRRDDGVELSRGGSYLEFSERTPMESPFVTSEERQNRHAIKQLMANHGFVDYPYEFWHFSKGDAYAEYLIGSHKPGQYGAVQFAPTSGETKPIADPERPLHSLEEIQSLINAAVRRLGKC